MVLAAMIPALRNISIRQQLPKNSRAACGTWNLASSHRNEERRSAEILRSGVDADLRLQSTEALRSFHKASELDPRAAMAYWGIAMALGPYINMDMDPDVHLKEACDAVDAGLGRAGVSETDSAWLHAAGARCPDYADPGRYVGAMRDLARRYADDPDAQTLYAEALLLPVRWHWYNLEGKPAEGVAEAERVLEGVLHRHPDHPGANHFYIHAVESSPTPERAVPSAQRLMGIVPAAATSCTCQVIFGWYWAITTTP